MAALSRRFLLRGSAHAGRPPAIASAARRSNRCVFAIVGSALVFVAAGCGFEPMSPDQPRSSELRDRPGIFSGESGTFVWRGGRRRTSDEQPSTEQDPSPEDEQD